MTNIQWPWGYHEPCTTFSAWLKQQYISDIIVQAMNAVHGALHGMDSYWEEVVGEYMKEWYKGSVSLR